MNRLNKTTDTFKYRGGGDFRLNRFEKNSYDYK